MSAMLQVVSCPTWLESEQGAQCLALLQLVSCPITLGSEQGQTLHSLSVLVECTGKDCRHKALHDYRALQIASKGREQVWVGMQDCKALTSNHQPELQSDGTRIASYQ